MEATPKRDQFHPRDRRKDPPRDKRDAHIRAVGVFKRSLREHDI